MCVCVCVCVCICIYGDMYRFFFQNHEYKREGLACVSVYMLIFVVVFFFFITVHFVKINILKGIAELTAGSIS